MILETADNCGQKKLMQLWMWTFKTLIAAITVHTQRAELTRIQLAQVPAYLDSRGVDSSTKTFV
jgi:hypothetical protein